MDEDSMFYWWPKVKDLGIPIPKTIMIPWDWEDFDEVGGLVDGNPSLNVQRIIEEVKGAAAEIGYPIFLRSDQSSHKHDWIRTCYVESEKDIPQHMAEITEFCFMVDIGVRGFAVREFLDLDWRFKSHRGMPVAAERRYFVRDDKVECWHPYWPPVAIERPTEEDWRELLRELQTPMEGEVDLLTGYARRIGAALGGYWSVDFCRHRNGSWYLTDMAMGEQSYHWGTCPNAPPEMLAQYGDPERGKPKEEEKGLLDFI